MLTRAAKRQLRHGISRTLIADYQRLALPFLCPALYTLSDSRCSRAQSTSSLAPSPRKRSRSPRPTHEGRMHARQLATAADPSYYGALLDYVPFEGVRHISPSPAQQSQAPLSRLRSRDLSDPTNLAIVPESPPQNHHLVIPTRSGITGDIPELQQNVYACVQVGRMDRAASLVRYMNWMLNPNTAELHDVHLRYVSGLMESILQAPQREKLSAMQKWVELDMKAIGVPIGYQILSYVIKASFLTLKASRLDRTLRRYLNWAEEEGEEELEMVLADGIFTDAEWEKLLLVRDNHSPEATVESAEGKALTQGTDSQQTYDQVVDSAAPPESPRASSSRPDDRDALLAPSKEAPPLKAVQQKGLGLESVKQSLVSLSSHKLQDIDDAELQGRDPRELLQQRLETDVLDAAMQRWREESVTTQSMRAQGRLSSPSLGSHLNEWVELMTAAVKAEMARADKIMSEGSAKSEDTELLSATPFLKMINVEKSCAVAILSYLESNLAMESKWSQNVRASNPESRKLIGVRGIVLAMGKALLEEAQAEKLLRTHKLEMVSSLSSTGRRRMISQLRRKKTSTLKGQAAGLKVVPDHDDFKISSPLRVRLGSFMMSVLLRVATIPVPVTNPATGKRTTETQPIAKHSIVFHNGKKLGIIDMNKELVDRLSKEPPSAYIAKHLPMLCPPRRWTSPKQGGYLQSEVDFVRHREFSVTSSAYMDVAHKRGDLTQVYAALDSLSQTPWRVYKEVFDVLTQVWNTGERFAKIAPANPTADLPSEPDRSDFDAHSRWKSAVRIIENELSGFHSQRCFQNFQLEVARAFLDDAFYCPHNIDFRGRAYPVPPYLNHMGPDHMRALFTFAEGKELGERGLFWIKIHLANVFGYDKASLDDRAAFVENHIDDIFDSADCPLDGKRWWLTAEDPWQCLGACIELRKALMSPDPAKYVSHLPIQQDGSCNGLQHYAALGGDELGAVQVSLEPGDKPGDVYRGVLDMVQASVSKDAENGDPRARILHGRLTRKCVKQPVMTNVYGVTFIGTVKQIRKQLVDIIPKSDIEQVDLQTLTTYVARLVFGSLHEMFHGAHLIQTWLGECGARISRAITPEQIERLQARYVGTAKEPAMPTSAHVKIPRKWRSVKDNEDFQFKSSIVWTTPLGMPIVQPYRDTRERHVETALQKIAIPISTFSDAVNKRKQLQGFPPNFIHSLDATHMMLTALRCRERGMTFAAIHDGFWTHAGDVDTLNAELREAFVNMHSENIVGRLREELSARYAGCYHWASCRDDTPAGRAIVAHLRACRKRGISVTPHRTSTLTNLDQVRLVFEEQERQRLLASSDSADVAAGHAMTTPASIYEAHGGDAVNADSPPGPSDMDNLPAASDTSFMDGAGAELDEDNLAAAGEPGPAEEQASNPTPKKKDFKIARLIYFWRKLDFPDPPPRGSFDVERVRQSKYFFS